MNKIELRRQYRRIRDDHVQALAPDERRRSAEAAMAPILSMIEPSSIVAGYAGTGSELDPQPILKRWKDNTISVLLPYFVRRHDVMTFRLWGGPLAPGPFGVVQPGDGGEARDPDIVLVPLTAIDLAGNRIGQGQGHYDRALANLERQKRVTTIGLAWDCQLADAIPADPWDQPLDYIATPTRFLETQG